MTTPHVARSGILAFVALMASVLLANVLVDRYGIVSVGLGLMAPAAVYAAGLALLARDAVQHYLGAAWAVVAVVAGATLSALVDPTLALASGCAFLAGESVDMAAWTLLRRRSTTAAVVVSGVVGGLVDTYVFLELSDLEALTGTDLFAGMVWAKAVVAVLGGVALVLLHRRRRA